MAKKALKEKQKRTQKYSTREYKEKQKITQKYSTREYTRCKVCGRPHSVLKKYGICRVCFRELAYKGEIPGVKKSSW